MKRTALASGLVIVAAIVGLLVSLRLARPGPGAEAFTREGYEAAIAANRTAVAERHKEVARRLDTDINSGKVKYDRLPIGEMPIDGAEPALLEDAVPEVPAIVRVELVAIRFYVGGAEARYRVKASLKGDLAVGSEFIMHNSGWPRLNDDGSWTYLVLPGQRVERPGDESIVFLSQQADLAGSKYPEFRSGRGGPYYLAAGRILPSGAADRNGLAGQPVSVLLDRIATAVRNP